MSDLVWKSATALAMLIRSREVSSCEVIEAFLARIEHANPLVNAIVQVTAESALDSARKADVACRNGTRQGLLHGVPFTAKDVFDVRGVIGAVGLPERRSFVPIQDAT
jgi:Asp-tRNA(Asn)/Glu-tRNA(Gln) amidotransferase A subunit family amidase